MVVCLHDCGLMWWLVYMIVVAGLHHYSFSWWLVYVIVVENGGWFTL